MEKRITTTVKCLIIDDEESAHVTLSELIRKTPMLEHCGSCYSVIEAVNVIARKLPDIIFLDVQMPEKSGLDLLGMLSHPRPQIIMTSGFKQYAVDGFEHQVTDFLLKPVSEDRFLKAVLKAIKQESPVITLPPMEERPTQQTEDMWFTSNGKILRLYFHEIIAIVALKDYVTIHYDRGIIVTHGNLGSIAVKLPGSQFIRIHRSCIVNRYAVRSIEGNTVTMVNKGEFTMAGRGATRNGIINQLTQYRK